LPRGRRVSGRKQKGLTGSGRNKRSGVVGRGEGEFAGDGIGRRGKDQAEKKKTGGAHWKISIPLRQEKGKLSVKEKFKERRKKRTVSSCFT